MMTENVFQNSMMGNFTLGFLTALGVLFVVVVFYTFASIVDRI